MHLEPQLFNSALIQTRWWLKRLTHTNRFTFFTKSFHHA
jgi:hypothetical protein